MGRGLRQGQRGQATGGYNQLVICRYVGGILDLVAPGADMCYFEEKNISPIFPRVKPRNWLPNVWSFA